MTEKDRHEYLADQLRANAALVFCPWCGTGNKNGAPTCCSDLTVALNARGERQLQSIIEQHKACSAGVATSIRCPYCEQINSVEGASPDLHPSEWKRPMLSPFCCSLFEQAAMAIAQRIAVEDEIENRKNIERGIDRASLN